MLLKRFILLVMAVPALAIFFIFIPSIGYAQTANESGSVGIQGTVSAPAPAFAPIISIPASGSSFGQIPITVGGICDGSLLVKLFKNGVFSGSAGCQNGSFSMQIDLFSGQNELIARQYDLLDQESPPSAPVSINYNDSTNTGAASERVTLLSNFAKRGANPRDKLTWPIVITGGVGPYAVTVEWGDGETSIYSIVAPGEFLIDHIYTNPGSYTVVIKSVDVNGSTAYLQLVAVGNGPLSQEGTASGSGQVGGIGGGLGDNQSAGSIILWQPALASTIFIVFSFWFGKRYAVSRIKKKIQQGERPFSY